MIGSIVGVGVFGLPYAIAQTGLAIGLLELLLIGVLLASLQLMFAEVVIQGDGDHRLVGYVRQYLGNTWGSVAMFAMACSVWGAMTAYLIVGGKFFSYLLSPLFGGSESVYALLVAVIAGWLIYGGLRFASKVETTIVVTLIFLFIFIILASIPHIQLSHWLIYQPENVFLPYGVLLFSMAGLGVVPEMRDVLGKKQEHKLGHAILIGMSVIMTLYLAFATVVFGVTGLQTTQAAFDGLLPVLGATAEIVASLLGALTILSIFMIAGIQLKDTFVYDYQVSKKTAWFAVMIVPIVLYLLGVRELIGLLGFVGSVFTGFLGILVVTTYLTLRKSPVCKAHTCILFPRPLAWMIITLFAGGIFLQIFNLIY